MSSQMIEIRAKFVERYGESYGRIMYVNECQRQGVDPRTGAKLVGGLSDE